MISLLRQTPCIRKNIEPGIVIVLSLFACIPFMWFDNATPFSIAVEIKRQEFLLDDAIIDMHRGMTHTISQESMYEDCIKL